MNSLKKESEVEAKSYKDVTVLYLLMFRQHGQLVVSSPQFFSKTALRIFLIFCMKVPYYKGKKRARRFFRKNSGSLIIHENVPKNGPK